MRWLLIVSLAVALAWTIYRLSEVERERYALLTGMCRDASTVGIDADCLGSAQPCTSRAWNIYYGFAP
ncbi:hypothetical protein SAMN05892877_105340 [Rhizobium subbaraonis]|uniref:Uncharacterized protein n=1 Tax=Rhizobium subbaraonis TaxID=908946 RepID=A0A285UAU3_9HYPH|nr:hypothetical protein SAMN05892877_105340 [Rhizobium subbaraonis]